MFPDSVMRLAKALLAQATEAKLPMAFAESCTGGLVAAAMTELDGASAVVDRGFVVYTNRAKTEMLGVPPALIEQYGAVSEEVASAMAEGALKYSGAKLAVSTTGIAGPTGGPDQADRAGAFRRRPRGPDDAASRMPLRRHRARPSADEKRRRSVEAAAPDHLNAVDSGRREFRPPPRFPVASLTVNRPPIKSGAGSPPCWGRKTKVATHCPPP